MPQQIAAQIAGGPKQVRPKSRHHKILNLRASVREGAQWEPAQYSSQKGLPRHSNTGTMKCSAVDGFLMFAQTLRAPSGKARLQTIISKHLCPRPHPKTNLMNQSTWQGAPKEQSSKETPMQGAPEIQSPTSDSAARCAKKTISQTDSPARCSQKTIPQTDRPRSHLKEP